MRGEAKLFAALLVDVGGAQYRKNFLVGRQRNGSGYYCAGCPDGLYDFLSRLVDEIVIVRLQFDADAL